MGKKAKYPEYSTGTISINGRTVSTNKRDKNNNIVDSNYEMSDTEQKIYDSVLDNMNSSLGNLFSISDEKREEWSSQLNALKNQGIEEINNIYTPMETNLKNDIANRFGNFDNSVFLDSLNEITDKRAKASAQLSESLLSTQDALYNQELQNQIGIITFLNNLNSAMNGNILNYITAANSNSNSGNSYNNAAYNSQLQQTQLFGNMIGSAANTAINGFTAGVNAYNTFK
ncbi:hypothetical protein HDR58_07615 [bacterium]|nr:hypothetical protein [bacterium]